LSIRKTKFLVFPFLFSFAIRIIVQSASILPISFDASDILTLII
jgi:hypothetical protein